MAKCVDCENTQAALLKCQEQLQQHRHGIDQLWIALGVTGSQADDVFTLAAREIMRLREEAKQ